MQKKLFITIFIILIAVVSIFIDVYYNSTEKPVKTLTNQIEDNKGMLTAKEAWALAYKDVQSVMNDPLLDNIQSTDDTEETPKVKEGLNGRRAAWNLSFGNAEGTMRVCCKVRDGKNSIDFVKENKDGLFLKGEYRISDLKIDSADAVKKAIKVKHIKPGNPNVEDDWIKGYHITIYGALTDPDSYDTTMVIRVTGISPDSPNKDGDSLLAHVFLDPKTGEILSASKQTGYDADGRTTWEAF